MGLPHISAQERTSLVESLLAIIRIQQDRIQQLEETVQHLRDEIAVLKGQKPRPDFKPSLLEATMPKTAGQEGGKRLGSAKRPKTAELHIPHEVPLHQVTEPLLLEQRSEYGISISAGQLHRRVTENQNTKRSASPFFF